MYLFFTGKLLLCISAIHKAFVWWALQYLALWSTNKHYRPVDPKNRKISEYVAKNGEHTHQIIYSLCIPQPYHETQMRSSLEQSSKVRLYIYNNRNVVFVLFQYKHNNSKFADVT